MSIWALNFVCSRLVSQLILSAATLTTSPASRNYDAMWVVHESSDVQETHMLEAALISHFQSCLGCRNNPDSGGEGALNRSGAEGPYYTYVTGGRADKNKRLG